MEAGTQGIFAGIVFAGVAGAVITLLAVTWRRAMNGPGNALLMHRMFEREGLRYRFGARMVPRHFFFPQRQR